MNKEQTKERLNWYAKMQPIMRAYVEGKTIQRKWKDPDGTEGWENVASPDWVHGTVYRVKPEPVYVPFETYAEFMEAEKQHGPWFYKISSEGRVLRKAVTLHANNVYWVDHFQSSKVSSCEFTTFFKDYLWADGTPCGKLAEI